MKITAYDKIQALKHSQLYRTDYLAYRSDSQSQRDCIVGTVDPCIRLSDGARRLCLKWDLQFPLNPCNSDENYKNVEDWYFSPVRHPKRHELKNIACASMKGAPDDETIININDRLAISVDLSFPVDTLMKAFRTIIKYHGAKSSNEKSGRHHEYDIWKVYELKEDGERKSFLKIAYILEAVEGLPTIISENETKAVERAYKKASRIIKFLEKSALQR